MILINFCPNKLKILTQVSHLPEQQSVFREWAVNLGVILAHSGCYNKILQIGWFKQQTLISYYSGGWEVQDQGTSRKKISHQKSRINSITPSNMQCSIYFDCPQMFSKTVFFLPSFLQDSVKVHRLHFTFLFLYPPSLNIVMIPEQIHFLHLSIFPLFNSNIQAKRFQ